MAVFDLEADYRKGSVMTKTDAFLCMQNLYKGKGYQTIVGVIIKITTKVLVAMYQNREEILEPLVD